MVSTTRGARLPLPGPGSGDSVAPGTGAVLGACGTPEPSGVGGAVPVRVTMLSLPPWLQPLRTTAAARRRATGATRAARAVLAVWAPRLARRGLRRSRGTRSADLVDEVEQQLVDDLGLLHLDEV